MAITDEKLKAAVAEAERFIQKAGEWQAAADDSIHEMQERRKQSPKGGWGDYELTRNNQSIPRQAGAVRRASMDLSRALADLRKYRV